MRTRLRVGMMEERGCGYYTLSRKLTRLSDFSGPSASQTVHSSSQTESLYPTHKVNRTDSRSVYNYIDIKELSTY